jgi:hypothetical protein
VLLFKIILAPVLIGLVSLAGRRWGPGVAGWLLGVPMNSGPLLLFLLLEQGHRFAAEAARASLLGILAWVAFCVTYAYCCVRMSWWWSTLAGWIAWSVVAIAILPVGLNVVWVFVLVALALAAVLLTFPRAPQGDSPAQPQQDLWLRMITASVMIVTLTGLAKILGPTRSGILGAFPAYTTILSVFTQRHGRAATVKVLKGVTVGLYTAATFFLVLSLLLMHLRGAMSFLLASAAGLVVQGCSLIYVRAAEASGVQSQPVVDS